MKKQEKNAIVEVENALRELRQGKGLTQAELAEKLEREDGSCAITADAISKIERREINLMPNVALRICEVFNVSLDWLYRRTAGLEGTPSAVLESLINIFQLVPAELACDFPSGEHLLYGYYKLSISAALDKFLQSITIAETLKQKGLLPEIGYESCVKGARQAYNEAVDTAQVAEATEYIVIQKSALTKEMMNTILDAEFEKIKEQRTHTDKI